LELAAGSENATDEALVEVVQILVDAGASLESFDDEETPLMRASMVGHGTVADELLKSGADPNWSKASNGETALYVACAEGHPNVARVLAAAADLNVRKTSNHETALYVACSKGHLDVVRELLNAGVDLSEDVNTVPRTGKIARP
jgi:ankyrin repeat protein